MHGLCDGCNRVLGASRSFDVGEEKDPTFTLKASPELPEDAGLSHAPLSGKQQVVVVLGSRLQYL